MRPNYTSFEFIRLNTTKSIPSVNTGKYTEHVNIQVFICMKYFPFFFPGIPSVSVTYSAIWAFGEVLRSNCSNISSLLDNLQETLEETLAQNCRLLKINATVQFTNSFLAFQVNYLFEYT